MPSKVQVLLSPQPPRKGRFFIGGDMDPEMLSRPRRFECARCNRCCSGQPGYVWLSLQDLEALSSFLRTSKRQFAIDYCKPVNIGLGFTLSLKEKADYDCIFLENSGCAVYSVRPAQCRTYPYWESLLETEENWEDEAEECPGIGKGPTVSGDTILCAVLDRRHNPPLTLDDIEELKGLENEWGKQ